MLILLFADRRGDLRVVLTMRASTLRNYSGTSHLTVSGFNSDKKQDRQLSLVEKQTHLTRSLLISLEGKLARRSVFLETTLKSHVHFE